MSGYKFMESFTHGVEAGLDEAVPPSAASTFAMVDWSAPNDWSKETNAWICALEREEAFTN
jgi:hypothetical protein